MIKNKDGSLRLRTALIVWALASVIAWLLFNCLAAASQTAITAIKQGIQSEEIYTPLEALMYRVIRILFFDTKFILATVFLWGLLFCFAKSINATWRNMTISIALIFTLVAFGFVFISKTKMEMAILMDSGAYIYLALLAPRLVFGKLRPGNII